MLVGVTVSKQQIKALLCVLLQVQAAQRAASFARKFCIKWQTPASEGSVPIWGFVKSQKPSLTGLPQAHAMVFFTRLLPCRSHLERNLSKASLLAGKPKGNRKSVSAARPRHSRGTFPHSFQGSFFSGNHQKPRGNGSVF